MSTPIDARGRSCPEPVLMAKKGFEAKQKAEILVDNATAKQNIQRLAKKLGAQCSIVEQGDDYLLTLVK